MFVDELSYPTSRRHHIRASIPQGKLVRRVWVWVCMDVCVCVCVCLRVCVGSREIFFLQGLQNGQILQRICRGYSRDEGYFDGSASSARHHAGSRHFEHDA